MNHMLLLMADGSVKAFGYNPFGQTHVPESRIRNMGIKVVAGSNHSLVLLRDGTVVGFGSNLYGETDPMPSEALPGGLGVVDIAAGPYYSIFVLRNGSVIGIGDVENEPLASLPRAILHNVSSINCRWRLCGAVKVSGEVILWGYNNSIIGADTPILPVPPEVQAAGAATLSVGNSHAGAMLRNGQGFVWGLNDSGQAKFPIGIAPIDVKSIVVGAWHTIVLLRTGQLIAFGTNGDSQLNVPDAVKSASVAGVAAGYAISCALLPSPPEPPQPRKCPSTYVRCQYLEPLSWINTICRSHPTNLCSCQLRSASAAFATFTTSSTCFRCVRVDYCGTAPYCGGMTRGQLKR
jgi:alpha-tubulin suppressor-like RCC1 family protein